MLSNRQNFWKNRGLIKLNVIFSKIVILGLGRNSSPEIGKISFLNFSEKLIFHFGKKHASKIIIPVPESTAHIFLKDSLEMQTGEAQ